MAIQALSSVTNNAYSNISFGKRGEKPAKNQSNPHVASSLKAVPLAALIAMSPLSTTNAEDIMRTEPRSNVELSLADNNPKVVQKKVYNAACSKILLGPADFKLKYINNDNNPSTVESVLAESDGTSTTLLLEGADYCYDDDIYGQVKSLNDYKYDVVGDDGRSYGTWTFSQLIIENDSGLPKKQPTIMNPDIIEDVRKFALSSSNNNAVEIKTIEDVVLPQRDFGLTTFKKLDTSWVERSKSDKFYHNGYTAAQFTSQVASYGIVFVSHDDNPDDYEEIIIMRDDGARFRLDRLRQLNLTVKTEDRYGEGEKITLNCLDISCIHGGKYTIYDDELYFLLANTFKDKKNNGGIKLTNVDVTVDAFENGGFGKHSYKEEDIL